MNIICIYITWHYFESSIIILRIRIKVIIPTVCVRGGMIGISYGWFGLLVQIAQWDFRRQASKSEAIISIHIVKPISTYLNLCDYYSFRTQLRNRAKKSRKRGESLRNIEPEVRGNDLEFSRAPHVVAWGARPLSPLGSDSHSKIVALYMEKIRAATFICD